MPHYMSLASVLRAMNFWSSSPLANRTKNSKTITLGNVLLTWVAKRAKVLLPAQRSSFRTSWVLYTRCPATDQLAFALSTGTHWQRFRNSGEVLTFFTICISNTKVQSGSICRDKSPMLFLITWLLENLQLMSPHLSSDQQKASHSHCLTSRWKKVPMGFFKNQTKKQVESQFFVTDLPFLLYCLVVRHYENVFFQLFLLVLSSNFSKIKFFFSGDSCVTASVTEIRSV